MNIALIGPQCAGKTLLAELTGFKIVKFATPLYDINYALQVQKNRKFMQDMSDLAKEYFGDGVFRDAFFRFNKYASNIPLICDDCRYLKEFDLVKKMGWYTVYVDAAMEVRKKRAELLKLDFAPNHPSEQEPLLLRDKCDIICNNNLPIANIKEFAKWLIAKSTGATHV